MKYLHAMIRITDINESLDFYCNKLGFKELRRKQVENRDIEDGRFTLIFLAAPGDIAADGSNLQTELELAYNHEADTGYAIGRNFGHLSYQVDDIYQICQRLMDAGVIINRPPKEGRVAFFVTPEDITLEILQKGQPLPPAEPWLSMGNTGHW